MSFVRVYNQNFMSAKDLLGIRKKKTCSWARARVLLKENSFRHPQRCFAISRDPNTMKRSIRVAGNGLQ
jgi:hypothetical protein